MKKRSVYWTVKWHSWIMFMIINNEVVLPRVWGAIVYQFKYVVRVCTVQIQSMIWKTSSLLSQSPFKIQWKRKRIFVEPHISVNLTIGALLSNDMQIQSNHQMPDTVKWHHNHYKRHKTLPCALVFKKQTRCSAHEYFSNESEWSRSHHQCDDAVAIFVTGDQSGNIVKPNASILRSHADIN